MLFLFRTIPTIVYSSHMVFPLYLASFKIHLRDQTPWQLLHTCITALIDNIEIIYVSVFLEKKMFLKRKDHAKFIIMPRACNIASGT